MRAVSVSVTAAGVVQVVAGKLTCVVAASTDMELAADVQSLFAQGNMRINLSRDVQGVEVCGALKNVLAIAAGIVEGKELGSNALAAVVCLMCYCCYLYEVIMSFLRSLQTWKVAVG